MKSEPLPSSPSLRGCPGITHSTTSNERASCGLLGGAKKRRSEGLIAPLSPLPKRVIIIGAGFAGLGAARTLQGAGREVEVILLEASGTVGGRARAAAVGGEQQQQQQQQPPALLSESTSFASVVPTASPAQLPSGTQVEAGATWFHGIHGNPLYEIAVWEGLVQDLRGDSAALKRQETNWKVDFARPLQRELVSGRERDVAEEALERFQGAALELSDNARGPSSEYSIGDFMRAKYDEAVRSGRFTPEELAVFSESWLFRERQQCSFDGFFSTDDVSATFPWEAIAESLASPLDIRFDHRVTSIEWGSGGVSVTCANGVELEADAVLVTCSIGVLQANHRTLFSPPLPDWKQAALGAVRLGVADKVFVEFEIEDDSSSGAADMERESPRQGYNGSSSMDMFSGEPSTSCGSALQCDPMQGPGQQEQQGQQGHRRPLAAGAGAAPSGAGAAAAASAARRAERRAATASASAERLRALERQKLQQQAALLGQLQAGGCSPLRRNSLDEGPSCSAGDPATSAHSTRSDGDTWRTGGEDMRHAEPWNMGRRGVEQQQELTSRAALVATGALLSRISSDGLCSLDDDGDTGADAESPRQAGQGCAASVMHPAMLIHAAEPSSSPSSVQTYVFMWPVPEPAMLGTAGCAAAQALLPGGLCPSPVPQSPLAALPSWLHGLHSIRFAPGPDWIQPSDEQRFRRAASNGSASGTATGAVAGAKGKTASAVLWITGEHALEMERQSDEALQSGIQQLLAAFPAVPLPPGAKLLPRVLRSCWGTDPLFLGSYSYSRAGMDTGDVADHLAEPLTSEEGMPVVMFAGEATHRHFMGTAHGAYMSGFREANRFLAALDQMEMLMAWSLAKVAAVAAHPNGPRSASRTGAAPPEFGGSGSSRPSQEHAMFPGPAHSPSPENTGSALYL